MTMVELLLAERRNSVAGTFAGGIHLAIKIQVPR